MRAVHCDNAGCCRPTDAATGRRRATSPAYVTMTSSWRTRSVPCLPPLR